MNQSFDFITFLDKLQPYLDSITSIYYALGYLNNLHDLDELGSLSTALSFHLEQIEKLCDETTKQFSKGKNHEE